MHFGDAALSAAGAAFFTWLLGYGWKRGDLMLNLGVWANRRRNPIGFWLLATIYVFVIAGLALYTLALARADF